MKLSYNRQSVLLSGTHLGPTTNFSFSLIFFFRRLRVCYLVAPTLMRGWVCNLLLLLVLASAIPFGSQSHGNQDSIVLPQFFRAPPPTWRARSPYLYPLGTEWPRYTPGHWIPFPSPLTTHKATVEVFHPASTRDDHYFVSVILWPTVSRSVHLGVRHPSGTHDQFFPLSLLLFLFRVCWCGEASLTRSRVCTFQFQPGITSTAFLRPESHGTHKHILLSIFLGLPQHFFFRFPNLFAICRDTFSKWCVGKRGRVEECSVAPLHNKRVKTLCGCQEKRYKLRKNTN
jgi:hypothetical protein